MSNGLDPDQDRHCVGPDLGPNCLCNGYQQTTKVAAIKERVKIPMVLSALPCSRKKKQWAVFAHSECNRGRVQVKPELISNDSDMMCGQF